MFAVGSDRTVAIGVPFESVVEERGRVFGSGGAGDDVAVEPIFEDLATADVVVGACEG